MQHMLVGILIRDIHYNHNKILYKQQCVCKIMVGISKPTHLLLKCCKDTKEQGHYQSNDRKCSR